MRETAPRRRSRKGLKAVSTVTHASASPPATITAVLRAPPSRAPPPFAMDARGPLVTDGWGGWRDARALCDGRLLAALGVWGFLCASGGGGRGKPTEGRGKLFGLRCTARKGKPKEEDKPGGGEACGS